jgi:outer membrane protein OmpA-like peptidoglycan-associated protein
MKYLIIIFLMGGLVMIGAYPISAQGKAEAVNLLSLQEGVFPVVAPGFYSGWPPEAILDESRESGWACEQGKVNGNVFVIDLVTTAAIERFEFDTAHIDEDGTGAKDVRVEVSSSRDSGFQTVLTATLADRADRQKYPAAAVVTGRWVRLTILNNHGSSSYTELMGFRGYGAKPSTGTPLAEISGIYKTEYSLFHVRQQGTALLGCYEYNEGLLQGTVEGRVMKITWREKENRGPAVMVFSTDGKKFQGYFWHAGKENREPGGRWDGEKVDAKVGGCPHWSGSLGGEMEKKLKKDGRVSVYGILFDLNSAVIRPESKPVLDEMVAMLKAEAAWKLTIEGHTDSSGGDTVNQPLSSKRAESVKTYLITAGIGADRLQTKGLGSSKPVADNGTELGRTQNRRVELVRN